MVKPSIGHGTSHYFFILLFKCLKYKEQVDDVPIISSYLKHMRSRKNKELIKWSEYENFLSTVSRTLITGHNIIANCFTAEFSWKPWRNHPDCRAAAPDRPHRGRAHGTRTPAGSPVLDSIQPSSNQCCGCGSGSGIRCLFNPGCGIQNKFFPDPGSWIPHPKPVFLVA
jgi:hypothetical protein